MALAATSPGQFGIPHDVLDEVAQYLLNQHDGRRNVTRDIKACSLVDRAFAAAFQPYLFQRTYISNSAGSNPDRKAAARQRLMDRLMILKNNPILQTYVKKLTITLHDAVTDPILPFLLDHFTILNSLVLASFTSGGHRISWTTFDPVLRTSITKLCNLPTLRRLDLSNFDSLPASLFLYQDHLTGISISGSRPVLDGVQPKDGGPVSGDEKRLDLNISNIDPSSLFPLVSHNGSFFARLRTLKSIHYPSSDEGINNLLTVAQLSSLEEIDFTLAEETSLNPFIGRRLDLSPLGGLKRLKLSTSRPKRPVWQSFLSMLSTAFEAMDTRQLEELTLTITDVEPLFLSELCNPELGWNQLDENILSKLESRRLKKLEIISIDIGIKRMANYIPIRVRNPSALIEDVVLLPSFPLEKTKVVLRSNVGEVIYDSQRRKELASLTA